MKLAFAQACADRLRERLASHAQRVEIAGSIRRQRPEVGDVDLVVSPVMHEEKDMLGTVVRSTNATRDVVLDWARTESWKVIKNGDDILIIEAKRVQVDFYWAPPERFGTFLLCRTGSREHNIWLAEIAKAAGGKWHPYSGLHLNRRVVAATELEIYGALDLPFLDPVRDRDLPRLHRIRPGSPTPPA